jgi:tripartite-type tricarboxylate transporter receptor subunit TctC
MQFLSNRAGSRRLLLAMAASALLACVAPGVAAQGGEAFPSRPVKLVVGYTPGGSTDAMARQVAQALSRLWNQPVVVENKPGAGSNIGAEFVAKSAPDGYTLLMWHDGLAANASLYKKLPYDPIKDLAPVNTVARVSIVMGVATNSPARSVKDVIDTARAKPGGLTYASCGPGTPHHIAGEMFKYYTKTDIVHVAYKGCAPALADVLGGHVPVFFQTLSNVTDHMKTGRVRVLAVSDPKRVADYPDLPTMVEAGVPNFVMTPWYGIFAPGGTPKELVARISADIAKVVASPELQATLKKSHYTPDTMNPEQFRKLVATDIERLGQVIRGAGMTAE